MIDLYTSATGNGRRAALALAECGLAHVVHRLDLKAEDHKKPEFLKINPAGSIPVIVDEKGPGGRPINIAQSGAIVLYCAEKSGKLIPSDPKSRIEAYEWFMQAATDAAPASSVLFYLTQLPEQNSATNTYFQQRLLKYCAIADQRLDGRDYLAGEFSIADLALYPVVLARKATIDAAPGFANLKAWERRIAVRPHTVSAIAANG